MDFSSIYASYQTQLNQVEQILHERSIAQHEVLSHAGQQLIDAGGKRLRPLFALICGASSHQNTDAAPRVTKVAAALELIHMATLVHDDVIDNAELRRGRPTVRSEFGNLAAMYTGDFLFARSIQLLAEIDDPLVHRQMSLGMVRMCQGEVEQIRDFYNWNQSIRTYLKRIQRKTALLISLSCSLGAHVAGATYADVNVLRQFGHYTGMAFQIIDDVLDFSGSEQVVGKPVGGDLRQGNITLPALLAARDKKLGKRLSKLIVKGMPEEAAEEAIELIVESSALDLARQLADTYLHKALSVLRQVSVRRTQEELAILTHFVAERAF